LLPAPRRRHIGPPVLWARRSFGPPVLLASVLLASVLLAPFSPPIGRPTRFSGVLRMETPCFSPDARFSPAARSLRPRDRHRRGPTI
jgi:hypothetical protein